MKIYLSRDNSDEPKKQVLFHEEASVIESIEDLDKIVKNNNHSASKFKGGYRCGLNWELSDCLIQDVDENCSIEDFISIFSKFRFYIATSRNHQIEKDMRKRISAPCDRYHVYFPLSKEYTNPEEYKELLETLNKDYKFFDHNVKDMARYIFKSGENAVVKSHDGNFIDSYLKEEINTRQEKKCEFTKPSKKSSYKNKLIGLLKQAAQKRCFDQYSEWIRLGMGLKNSGFSINDWKDLSWENVDDKSLAKKWDSFGSNKITEGTLIYWAREIDPEFLLKSENQKSSNKFDTRRLSVLLSDADFCERFVKIYKTQIRFVKGLGWARYNGKNWDVGIDQNEMYRLIIQAANKVFEEEIDFLVSASSKKTNKEQEKENQDRLKQFMASKTKYQNKNGIQSALELLKGESSILCEAKEFNKGNFVNLTNGVYDLDKDKLINHNPELMFSTISDYKYMEGATSELWKIFISDVFMDRTEIMDFIQKAMGYSICSSMAEEKLFFTFGPIGANGKSTFFNILAAIFGTAAKTISSKVLMDSNGSEAQEQLAQLVNARFVRSTEIKKNARFDESIIKAVSGKDMIRCRALYQNSIEYYPRFKLWIFGNHKPGVDENGNGFWRRLVLIPFDREFKEDEQDKGLEDKLLSELPGIFNWILEGYRKYKTEGLVLPDSLKKLVEAYKLEENKVLAFLNERTIKAWDRLEEHTIPFKEFYIKYQKYCEDSGLQALSKIKLSVALEPLQKKVGFTIKNGAGNRKEIRGLMWNEGEC
jgi:P4 family phage/plasmid primase-like protien